MPHVMGTLSALKHRLSAVVVLLLTIIIPLTAGKPDGAPSSSLIPPDARLVEAAFTADLDGDGFSDLRARLVSSTGVGEWTILLGSANARPLYLVAGSAPFDPWAVLPGDSNRDGAVDEHDLAMWMRHGSAAELFVFSMFEGMNIFSPLVEAVRADEVSRPFPIGLHVQVDHAGAERLFPGNVFVVPGLFADGLPPGVVEELMAGLERLLGNGAGMGLEQGVSLRGQQVEGIGSSDGSGGSERPDDRERHPRFLMDDDDDDDDDVLPGVPANALREVEFDPDGRHLIFRDRLIQIEQSLVWVAYSGDEWLDGDYDGNANDLTGDDHRHPLAYTRQAAIGIERVGFRIAEAATFNLAMWEIIGSVGGNPVFTGTNLMRKAGDDDWDVIYSESVAGTFSGSDFIDVWDDWEITWYVKQVDAPAQKILGSSKNTVYFLLGTPALNGNQNELLHYTIVDIACRGSMGKDRNDNTPIGTIVYEDIWPRFATKEIQRVQDLHEGVTPPAVLGYYRSRATVVTFARHLLHTADGQCASWVHLLAMCIRAHGNGAWLNPANNGWVTIKADPVLGTSISDTGWFFVKNWDSPPGESAPYPHSVIFESMNALPTSAATPTGFSAWYYSSPQYSFTNPLDADDLAGLPGQGDVENPHSLFNLHFLLWFEGYLYDPSYGDAPIQGGGGSSPWIAAAQQRIGNVVLYYGAFYYNIQFGQGTVPGFVFTGATTSNVSVGALLDSM